ncbi:MAG: amidohydrolase/deacetylase family metallohydrolase [Acidobacteria bacterium]|nr:amidohydrolase/deacetylase family metallohydrolase [Acidobacteriota bacterium]MBI3280554.1 amidohydrolase/deacetylase family metallohydrolase [Acidobacteriota bacterium]
MNRRAFVSMLGGATAALAQQRPYDILIRNGEVRDPGQKLRRRADVAIRNGRIAAVEDRIAPERALDVIDASGLYVVPGLVDLHTHCYHSATATGIEADPVAARSGVTTWVDAGTFGYSQMPGFRRFIVNPAQVRIYGFVYLYMNDRNPDDDAIRYIRSQMRATGETATRNRDIILGVKVQVGSNMSGRYSPEIFRIARELCDKYKLKMMAHISFAPPETDEVMPQMRPGDVVTHCYNTHTIGILDANKKVRASVREARSRGVHFDVGHGSGSFNFAIARQALEQGFPPDSISTDVYSSNINGPVYDLPTTMSKLLALGMSFDDVVEKCTAAPARVVDRLPGMGSITAGGPADLALLAIESGSFQLIDSQKNLLKTEKRIVSRLTICRGKRLVAPM